MFALFAHSNTLLFALGNMKVGVIIMGSRYYVYTATTYDN